MTIKFEEKHGEGKPVKKVNGRAYGVEEPAAAGAEPTEKLPFGKPVRPEKKGRRK